MEPKWRHQPRLSTTAFAEATCKKATLVLATPCTLCPLIHRAPDYINLLSVAILVPLDSLDIIRLSILHLGDPTR